MSMKNFNDSKVNRTRDLPTCSAVPQPTAPPRAPKIVTVEKINKWQKEGRTVLFRHIVEKDLLVFCIRWEKCVAESDKDLKSQNIVPINRPTDVTCDRFLFFIYMCITLHVSSIKRSSSEVPHRTYSHQFLCLCLSAALSCKKLSYKTVPRTDTNTETGSCMYSKRLLMMSAWRSKHVELYTYR
jgi:hypothetical protein